MKHKALDDKAVRRIAQETRGNTMARAIEQESGYLQGKVNDLIGLTEWPDDGGMAQMTLDKLTSIRGALNKIEAAARGWGEENDYDLSGW